MIPGPFYEEGNRDSERFRAMKYFHPGHRLEAIVRAERDRAKPPRQAGDAQESPAEEQGPRPPGRRGQGLRFTPHATRFTQDARRNTIDDIRLHFGRETVESQAVRGPGDAVLGTENGLLRKVKIFFIFCSTGG